MLDKKLIEERKKDLEKKRKNLESQLSKIAYKDGDDYKPKFQSIGDKDEDNELEVSNFEERVDAEKQLEKMLEDIDEALSRIKKGSYGYCENCQQEIDPSRLRAIPWATTCTSCERK